MGTIEGVCLRQTAKFFVIAAENEPVRKPSSDPIARKAIFLDIDEPYTRQVIQQAFRHPARNPYFHITLGPGAVAEYERIDWDAVFAGKHGASSYCIRKGLSRKAQLAFYTKLHISKNPDSKLRAAIPQSVVLDTWPVWEDDSGGSQAGLADVVVAMGSSVGDPNRRRRLDKCLLEAKTAMADAEQTYEQTGSGDPPVWILKGSTVNKGVGIHIVHLYEQVVDICWSTSDIREWVLQKYVSRPLLLRKRKFHIRAYVVAVSALRVYFSRDCLALCSGTKYKHGDTGNLLAHITNTAFQDLDPNFREDKCVLLWNSTDISPILVRDGYCVDSANASARIERVLDDMEIITGDLFRAYESEFGVFAPIESCFEHYGLDFVVDENWQVYLLEVNPGPDFKQTGSRLRSAIENLMGSTIDVALLDDQTAAQRSTNNLSMVYNDDRIRGLDRERNGGNTKRS